MGRIRRGRPAYPDAIERGSSIERHGEESDFVGDYRNRPHVSFQQFHIDPTEVAGPRLLRVHQ